VLYNACAGAAAFFGTDELAVSPDEAQGISDAVKEVVRYHPVQFDPAKVAVVNLLTVLAGIIGVHVMAYRTRIAGELARGERVNRPVPGPGAAAPKPAAASAPGPPAVVNIADIFKGAKMPSDIWPQSGSLPTGWTPPA
jgi:hypothetical protein